MGKIKKLIENELVGGTQSTDVYPVTSVKAVYDENNERLDHILNRRGVVNISTNYNDDHIAEVLTLEQAIAKVPASDKVLGFQGKFLTEDGWRTYTFVGESLSEWGRTSKWLLPITSSKEVIDNISGETIQEVVYKYVTSTNKNALPYIAAIKELYIDITGYNTPDIPIYLRVIYREHQDSSGRDRWIIQFTRNNSVSEVVCNVYSYTNIENEEVIKIASTGKYGDVTGYIVIDWTNLPRNSIIIMDGLLLDSSFNIKNSPGIYNYIYGESNKDSINIVNQSLQTKKTGITYISEDSIYFNDIIKELYIDKSNYTGENDIYLRLIRRNYSSPEGKQIWVVQFVNGDSTNIVANVYSYDNSVESEVVNIVSTSGLYGDVKGYAVIDWDKMDIGANIFANKKVLESAFNIKNSPTISAFVENNNLSKELSIQQSKINIIKSEPLYIEESEILYNDAIKELYINKSNYIGENDLYLRTVYRESEDATGRIRWIIQVSNGRTTNIVCTFYQYNAVDESQLITPLRSTGLYGDVTGYIILDWTKFEKNKTTLIDKKISDIAFDIKNSPLIKNYVDSLPVDWKEYPTTSVFKKGYLPNSGNGFALFVDRTSNINYSVHPKILDKTNNVNPKCFCTVSMLEDKNGSITEESVYHYLNLVLKDKGYNRLWIAVGINNFPRVGKRTDYDTDYISTNGHVVTIPDEDVSSLSLSSNKAVIFYPVQWHNTLMESTEYKPYIKVYDGNTIQDSEEGLLYQYEIDWRNPDSVSLFNNMLDTVSSAMENKINGISIKSYISVLEIAFVNMYGEGSLTKYGTKIPEYENLQCLKDIVEHYKTAFPDILLAAPALSMSDSSNVYTDAMKDYAVYLATTNGNNASKELGVFMDNVGFFSAEKTTYSLKYNGIYILDAIKSKRSDNKGIYVGELANTMGYWSSELKNDWLPYSIKELGLAMYNHDIRTNETHMIQTGVNYIELLKDCYDKAGYRFYIIGNRSYYTRDGNNILVNVIFWIGNMGYSNLYSKFWKPYVIVRTDTGDYVGKVSLSNLDLTKVNHSDWNVGIDYTTPYRKLNMSVDVSSYSIDTRFNLYLAIEDSDGISDNMYLSIDGRNDNNEYLIYNDGYSISYNLDGGENSEFNPSMYYRCRENVILYPAYKNGYIFKGWYADSGFNEEVKYIESNSSIGDIILYAKFEMK